MLYNAICYYCLLILFPFLSIGKSNMAIILYVIQQVNEKADVVLKKVSPRTLKKTGVISLGTAALLTVAYSFYRKITSPPKHMRHLPYIGSYHFIKDVFTNELYETYSKRRIMPLLEQGSNGFYMVSIGFNIEACLLMFFYISVHVIQ